MSENTEAIEAEIDRLKRGDFTEDEFQNLCHNLSEEDECRFKRGCRAYWRKLGWSEELPMYESELYRDFEELKDRVALLEKKVAELEAQLSITSEMASRADLYTRPIG